MTFPRFKTIALLALALLWAGSTLAAPQNDPVVIKTEALVEQTVATPEGRREVKRVPLTMAVPGQTVVFVNTVTNQGKAPAEGVTVANPIPKAMAYVDGTAGGDEVVISFSVDGGKSFDRPGKLQVLGADGLPRTATGNDYTHIRWQFVKPLPPGAVEQVEFRAVVK